MKKRRSDCYAENAHRLYMGAVCLQLNIAWHGKISFSPYTARLLGMWCRVSFVKASEAVSVMLEHMHSVVVTGLKAPAIPRCQIKRPKPGSRCFDDFSAPCHFWSLADVRTLSPFHSGTPRGLSRCLDRRFLDVFVRTLNRLSIRRTDRTIIERYAL